ncbi:uncharacterized protein OCT59_002863 [Rhizophagus irregularis]|uniref:uncharacterized protein n=1 Tax=Rhizophagus irregularis TaxID=588596 RepID=UPI003316CB91|nr:hypothetical protein OCT59_002863 [Rhizophagus irregularis]
MLSSTYPLLTHLALDGVAVVNLHTIAKRCPVLTSLKLFDIGKVMRFAYISELRDLTMLLLLIDDMSVDYLRIISSLSDLQTLDIEMQRDSPVLDISCLSTMKKLTDITLRCNEERYVIPDSLRSIVKIVECSSNF